MASYGPSVPFQPGDLVYCPMWQHTYKGTSTTGKMQYGIVIAPDDHSIIREFSVMHVAQYKGWVWAMWKQESGTFRPYATAPQDLKPYTGEL